MQGRARSIWLVVAIVATAAAVIGQLLFVLGFGGWFPGWQPWPFLLLAAPAWLLARPWPVEPPRWSVAVVARFRRVPAAVYVVAVLAIGFLIWAGLQRAEPYLGHEEAVYANKARFWLDGTPDSGWGLYRPVGLPALGYLGLAVRDTEGSLRVVALLLLLFMLVVAYLIGSRWTAPRQSIVALLILLAGLGFLRRTPQFLNDIGSTALLLLVVLFVVRAQEKPKSWSLAIATVPAVAAFYLRYGVAGSLLAIALGALLAYGPRAWVSLGRRALVAAALLIVGLLPHFVYAWQQTGSPLGMIFSATEKAQRAYVGDGFVYYLGIFPYRLAGDLGGVVMVAGLVVGFLAGRRLLRVPHVGDRRKVFLASTSVLLMVVLGIATDGEPRFIYLSVVLLTILGVGGIAELLRRWRGVGLTGIALLAALTIPATFRIVADGWLPDVTAQEKSVVAAGSSLSCKGSSKGQGDAPLLVTGYEPDLGWYSGCESITYSSAFGEPLPKGRPVSFIRFERGRLQRPESAIRELAGRRPVTVSTLPAGGALGTVRILTFTP